LLAICWRFAGALLALCWVANWQSYVSLQYKHVHHVDHVQPGSQAVRQPGSQVSSRCSQTSRNQHTMCWSARQAQRRHHWRLLQHAVEPSLQKQAYQLINMVVKADDHLVSCTRSCTGCSTKPTSPNDADVNPTNRINPTNCTFPEPGCGLVLVIMKASSITEPTKPTNPTSPTSPTDTTNHTRCVYLRVPVEPV